MIYLVAEVYTWHKMKGYDLRKVAKTSILHSRHTSQEEARKVCSSLNSGHKQQRYWVLDKEGKIVRFRLEKRVSDATIKIQT